MLWSGLGTENHLVSVQKIPLLLEIPLLVKVVRGAMLTDAATQI